jgi:hypothetical protein
VGVSCVHCERITIFNRNLEPFPELAEEEFTVVESPCDGDEPTGPS